MPARSPPSAACRRRPTVAPGAPSWGEVKLAFEEKHNTSVAVPSIFLVALPVFALSDRFYRLPVRLRYRVDQGKTFWTPLLWRADETLDKAIQDNAEKAKTDTGLPMFYGTGPLR